MENNLCFLEGNEIYLRPLSFEDIEGPYLTWFNDKDICKFNSHHRFPITKEELIAFVKDIDKHNDNLVLAAIRKKDSYHVGNVSLQGIDWINRSAEMASIIGTKGTEGLRYTVEAIELIIEHAFEQLNIRRVYGGSFNPVIDYIMQSLGFTVEGKRRQAIYKNNQYYDIIEYGLLYDEWQGKKVAISDTNK